MTRYPSEPLDSFSERYGYVDQSGYWPTTQQLKAQHLAHVTRELEELKQQQEWADLEDQWATMEQEDKR